MAEARGQDDLVRTVLPMIQLANYHGDKDGAKALQRMLDRWSPGPRAPEPTVPITILRDVFIEGQVPKEAQP